MKEWKSTAQKMGHGDFPLGKEAENNTSHFNSAREGKWTVGTPLKHLPHLPSVGFEKTQYRDSTEDGTIGKLCLRCFYAEEILSQALMCFTRTEYFPIMFHGSAFFLIPCKLRWDKCSHKINISLSSKTTDK